MGYESLTAAAIDAVSWALLYGATPLTIVVCTAVLIAVWGAVTAAFTATSTGAGQAAGRFAGYATVLAVVTGLVPWMLVDLWGESLAAWGTGPAGDAMVGWYLVGARTVLVLVGLLAVIGPLVKGARRRVPPATDARPRTNLRGASRTRGRIARRHAGFRWSAPAVSLPAATDRAGARIGQAGRPS